MNDIRTQYLTKKEAAQKYSFLSENMLKNILFKNIGGFREKVIRRVGRKILLDEVELLRFIAESKEF